MRRYESFNPWEAKLQNVMDMYPPVGVKSFGMTKKLAKTRLFWEKHPTFALGLLRSHLVPASFQSVAVFENGIERHWNEDGGPNERNENEEGADCGSFRPPSTLFDPRSLELWSVRPRFCHYMERFILSFRTHSETK